MSAGGKWWGYLTMDFPFRNNVTFNNFVNKINFGVRCRGGSVCVGGGGELTPQKNDLLISENQILFEKRYLLIKNGKQKFKDTT